jgi:hypothetical protein
MLKSNVYLAFAPRIIKNFDHVLWEGALRLQSLDVGLQLVQAARPDDD